MFTLAMFRKFEAYHYLIGGDWGEENELHSHQYSLEVRVQGRKLDEHGYLVDIDQLGAILDSKVNRYSGQTLNEQEEFKGLNPSIEHFARILSTELVGDLGATPLTGMEVRLWEDEIAWASYRLELDL